MSNTAIPIDISSNKDLVKLAEEVRNTKTPRALTKDDETLAVLMPVGTASPEEEEIFAALCRNEAFVQEAEDAKKQLATNPSHFTNLAEKYAHLIKPAK